MDEIATLLHPLLEALGVDGEHALAWLLSASGVAAALGWLLDASLPRLRAYAASTETDVDDRAVAWLTRLHAVLSLINAVLPRPALGQRPEPPPPDVSDPPIPPLAPNDGARWGATQEETRRLRRERGDGPTIPPTAAMLLALGMGAAAVLAPGCSSGPQAAGAGTSQPITITATATCGGGEVPAAITAPGDSGGAVLGSCSVWIDTGSTRSDTVQGQTGNEVEADVDAEVDTDVGLAP